MDSMSIYFPENFVGPVKVSQYGVHECARTLQYDHPNYVNFKPTYLYIKLEPNSGTLYFGKTIKSNILKYPGSGKTWGRILKKNQCKTPETVWYKLFSSPEELVVYALTFSAINNIVHSSGWANIIPEDGINGGMIGCGVYKNIHTGERKILPTDKVSSDWIAFGTELIWMTNKVTGETRRLTEENLVSLSEDWERGNGNLTDTRMFIDENDVIHQVTREEAEINGWKEYSLSQNKRLYSNGVEVHLYEHDKQPEGYEIYDEKFGRRMYTLSDGSRKWFAPDEVPEGAVEFCSTSGARQYIHPETRHIVQVPHGTQPEGYVEYSAAKFNVRCIDDNLEIRKCCILDPIPTGWHVIPTKYTSTYGLKVMCINDEGETRCFYEEPTEGWIPYNKVSKTICDAVTFGLTKSKFGK